MLITRKKLVLGLIIILLFMTLFTPMQAYYSAYIHVFIFLLLYFLNHQHKIVNHYLGCAIAPCLILCVISQIKQTDSLISLIGFFLHYLTWPIILVYVINYFSTRTKKKLLRFIFLICFVGCCLSLIQLGKNPEISRLLAGNQLQGEKEYYYKLGVGGYGFVFSVAFLSYGAIRWTIFSKTTFSRIFLLFFLALSYYFVIVASYTLAILLAISLACWGLLFRFGPSSKAVIVCFLLVVLIVLGKPILEFFAHIATSLNLEWVARRFTQLLTSLQEDSFSSLRRVELYTMSLRSFLSNPLFGGASWGGHSSILDAFAKYGLGGICFLWILVSGISIIHKSLNIKQLPMFFASFIIFCIIDTCSVMQIPVVVFFVVPLIFHVSDRNVYPKSTDVQLK